MVRILQVGKFYPPYRGGIETVLKSLCDGLAARGFAVSCLVTNTVPRTVTETVDGIEVARMASLGSLHSVAVSPSFVRALSRRARDADIVHVHQQNPLADLGLLVSPPATPVVVTCHSAIVRQRLGAVLWQPVLDRVWRRAARVVVASPPLAALPATALAAGRAAVVIPYGTRIENGASPSPERARAEAPEPLILSVGRLVGYKGFDVLLAAMKDVPHARLVIVGSGPLRARLEDLARALGVARRFQLFGEVSPTRLTELYRLCDVFVLPSVSAAEAFGMVQLEAMAHAKPVVSTNLPTGVPWVNRHGETGLVVPPGDVPSLAAALRELVRSRALRERLGAAGRRRVEAEFTVDRMVDRYAELYRAILDGPRTNGTRAGGGEP